MGMEGFNNAVPELTNPDELERVDDVAQAQTMAEAGNSSRMDIIYTKRNIETAKQEGDQKAEEFWKYRAGEVEGMEENAEFQERRAGTIFELSKLIELGKFKEEVNIRRIDTEDLDAIEKIIGKLS
jgi:hypothetical protein